MKKIVAWGILAAALSTPLYGPSDLLAAWPETAEQEVLFTAYNMWYESPENLWCINYKIGEKLPAGTLVTDVKMGKAKKGRVLGGIPLAITFRTEDGQTFLVNFKKQFHPGKNINDYMDVMFTTKNFGALTAGFTADEVEAIEDGVIIPGMRKEAVLISYGYPPEHRTASLENKKWIYWSNRFSSKEICFDDKDLAEACKQVRDDAL